MSSNNKRLNISVLGPFALSRGDGTPIHLKGAKNQALLAMLALSPRMARPRRWLEDKLWSRFGAEQAGANLRQALSKIRTSLGPDVDVLLSDRSQVALAPASVRVDLLEDGMPSASAAELLQGLDVRDPEFEEWLRLERAELADRLRQLDAGPGKGVMIACRSLTDLSPSVRVIGEVLTNQIGESLSEQVRAWRQAPELIRVGEGAAPCDVLITAETVADDGQHAVFLRAVHQSSGRILYSKLQHFATLEGILHQDEAASRFVFEAADRIIGKLAQVLESSRAEGRATALSRLALYRLFSFESQALGEAHDLMAQAYERDDNPVYLAWSGVVRATQYLENSEGDIEVFRSEAVDLARQACELSPENGLIRALASKVRGSVLRDHEGSLALAHSAVQANPQSAYAWLALAEAQLLAGQSVQALAHSTRARNIAWDSPFRHWWDMAHCLIAIACNETGIATEAGEAAVRAVPNSRPAHRYLLALYALREDHAKAKTVLRRLRVIEPGFSLEQMLNDARYPVTMLRHYGLLEPIRALL